jgi:hypothetical protein
MEELASVELTEPQQVRDNYCPKLFTIMVIARNVSMLNSGITGQKRGLHRAACRLRTLYHAWLPSALPAKSLSSAAMALSSSNAGNPVSLAP